MLQVPADIWEEWTNTDLVGFEKDITTDKGHTITILVEKDFQCLDGTDVKNEDASQPESTLLINTRELVNAPLPGFY